jgi:hypothetical protein
MDAKYENLRSMLGNKLFNCVVGHPEIGELARGVVPRIRVHSKMEWKEVSHLNKVNDVASRRQRCCDHCTKKADYFCGECYAFIFFPELGPSVCSSCWRNERHVQNVSMPTI